MTAEFWITQAFNGLSYGALLFLLRRKADRPLWHDVSSWEKTPLQGFRSLLREKE